MAINEVKNWLSGPKGYADGLKIFAKHCTSSVLLKMLSKGESKFNKEKLHKEMVLIAAAAPPPPTSEAPKEILTDSEYKEAGKEIRDLKAKAAHLFKENSKRHNDCAHILHRAKLAAVALKNDESKYSTAIDKYLAEHDVGTIVHQILDVDDELAEIYYKIDYWKVHKKLPEVVAEEKATVEGKYELKRKIQNVACLISKCKKNPKRILEIPALTKQKKVWEDQLHGLI